MNVIYECNIKGTLKMPKRLSLVAAISKVYCIGKFVYNINSCKGVFKKKLRNTLTVILQTKQSIHVQ